MDPHCIETELIAAAIPDEDTTRIIFPLCGEKSKRCVHRPCTHFPVYTVTHDDLLTETTIMYPVMSQLLFKFCNFTFVTLK